MRKITKMKEDKPKANNMKFTAHDEVENRKRKISAG